MSKMSDVQYSVWEKFCAVWLAIVVIGGSLVGLAFIGWLLVGLGWWGLVAIPVVLTIAALVTLSDPGY